MPQSLSSVLIHLVFSPHNREPLIAPAIEPQLHPYMASVFRGFKSPALTIDGTTDHLHILFSLARVISIADLVQEVKTETSKWIKKKDPSSQIFIGKGLRHIFDRPIATYFAEDIPSQPDAASPAP